MKKLSLNRDTLRNLSDDQSNVAMGGNIISAGTGCTLCISAPTAKCINSGYVPCSLRTGCCPLG